MDMCLKGKETIQNIVGLDNVYPHPNLIAFVDLAVEFENCLVGHELLLD